MNLKKLLLFAITLGLIGGTAAVLSRVNHKLGNPGVRLSAQPLYDEDGKIVSTNSVDLPVSVLNYQSQLLPITQGEKTLPADTIFGRRHYVAADGFQTTLSVVLMGMDRTSIHKPEVCLPAQGWTIEKRELAGITLSRPPQRELQVIKLIAGKMKNDPSGQQVYQRAVFTYWLVTEGATVPQHHQMMWSIAKELVSTGVLQRWAYVLCSAQCAPGEEERTFARLKEFIAECAPHFQLMPESTNLGSSLDSAREIK